MQLSKIDQKKPREQERKFKKRNSLNFLLDYSKFSLAPSPKAIHSRDRVNSTKSIVQVSQSSDQIYSDHTHSSLQNHPENLTHPQNPVLTLLQKYQNILSAYQRNQLLTYRQIFFFNNNIRRVLEGDSNFGYDKNGAYQLVLGDHIAYRYQIKDLIGQGAFSQVISAYDHKQKETVAMKINKNKLNFQEKVQNEIDVIEKLVSQGKNSHIPDLKNHFDFRNHKILVFPMYESTLLKFLKENAPVPLQITQLFASQILRALHVIHQSGFIHCDLKPENIMFSNPENLVVIDYGSTCQMMGVMCEYIQSRYYRAPEVVIGLPYSFSIDIWSFGCILAEFFLGRPLFKAENSHELIVKMAAIRGKPPLQYILHGQKSSSFFDQNKQIIPLDQQQQPNNTLFQVLEGADPNLVDLVDSCLNYYPSNRPTAREAFLHPFFGNSKRKKNVKQKTY